MSLTRRHLRLATLGVLAVVPGSAFAPSAAEPPAPPTLAREQAPVVAPDSVRELVARADLGRIRGSEDARVWIVVISDFQCPYCKVWHEETAPRIEGEYVRTGRARIAYLNFPIATHRNARPAHEAAMCAAEQGRFWPVADALFATQDTWKRQPDAVAFFDSLARSAGVDIARQRACVAKGNTRSLIDADYERGVRAGVGSTPTFLIGGRLIIGAQPFPAFKQAIDAALASAPSSRP